MKAGYHPGEKEGTKKIGLKKQGFYHWPVWRRLRVLALQRDHYLCQECLRQGRLTKATEVHHRKSVEDFPELALSLDNLESLCWDCHEKTKARGKRAAPSGVRVIRIGSRNLD